MTHPQSPITLTISPALAILVSECLERGTDIGLWKQTTNVHTEMRKLNALLDAYTPPQSASLFEDVQWAQIALEVEAGHPYTVSTSPGIFNTDHFRIVVACHGVKIQSYAEMTPEEVKDMPQSVESDLALYNPKVRIQPAL
jgi:hypothetical protein